MRPANQKDSDQEKHNWDWIDHNRNVGKRFALERCPYRKLHSKLQNWLDDGKIKLTDIPKHYNQYDHSVIKIDARDTHLEFTILWASKGNKGIQCYPLKYEYDPAEFLKCVEIVLARCEKLLGVSDQREGL